MKKVVLIASLVFVAALAQAQVFNTGQTLKKNAFALGVEPVVMIDGPSDGFNLFVHGGYGIKSGIDFGMKFGFGSTNYFGADVEWALGKNFSLTTGAHNFGEFGLDAAFNIVFPIKSDARIFTGFDMDIVFADEVQTPVWVPIGVEIGLRSNMSFIFEAEIGLNDVAYHLIGGGLSFYF